MQDNYTTTGGLRHIRSFSFVDSALQIPAVAIPVRELAVAMSKKANEVVLMLRQMGESNASATSMVEPDIAQMVAMEFGLRTKLLKLKDRLAATSVAPLEEDARVDDIGSCCGVVSDGRRGIWYGINLRFSQLPCLCFVT